MLKVSPRTGSICPVYKGASHALQSPIIHPNKSLPLSPYPLLPTCIYMGEALFPLPSLMSIPLKQCQYTFTQSIYHIHFSYFLTWSMLVSTRVLPTHGGSAVLCYHVLKWVYKRFLYYFLLIFFSRMTRHKVRPKPDPHLCNEG